MWRPVYNEYILDYHFYDSLLKWSRSTFYTRYQHSLKNTNGENGESMVLHESDVLKLLCK